MRSSFIHLVMLAAMVTAGCDRGDDKNSAVDAAIKNDIHGSAQEGVAAQDPNELPEIVVNEGCGINSPEPGKSYDRTVMLPAWGYVYDSEAGTIPLSVTLRISSPEAVVMTVPAIRGRRPDVAAAFGRPELEESGFGAEMDIASLSPGQYTFSVVQELDAKRIVCESSGPFTVM